MGNNVVLFTPAARIKMLEEQNQVQYVAIRQLLDDLRAMQEKIDHLEKLLISLPLDINVGCK